MSHSKIRTARLLKQQRSLINQPIDLALVKRSGNLNFYFCLYGLDGVFKNGFYFGLLQLHDNYPFAAPKLYFYTPNGRYDVNMPICTSFTNYHQQSWTSAWNVRSLIQGTISFMYSHQASYGCRADTDDQRKKYAQQSLTWNMNNQLFVSLFGEQIKSKLEHFIKLGITIFDKSLLKDLKKQQSFQQIQNNTNNQFRIQNQLTQNKIGKAKILQNNNQFQQNLQNEKVQHQLRQPLIDGDLIQDQQVFDEERQRQKKEQKDRKQKRQKRQRIKKIAKGAIIFLGIGILIGLYITRK